jgi:hypothetical protein
VYEAGAIFPKRMLTELNGFKEFLETGYTAMCKALEHDVLDAFKLSPGVRSKHDVTLI